MDLIGADFPGISEKNEGEGNGGGCARWQSAVLAPSFFLAIFFKCPHKQLLPMSYYRAAKFRNCRRCWHFLGSANTVTVGFPPTISGMVSFRMTPPSPEMTATYWTLCVE